MLVVEINDAAITVVRDGEILRESPGYALLDAGVLLLGEAALHAAHIKPVQVVNNYWDRLSHERLPIPAHRGGNNLTYADLARLHLKEVLQPWRDAAVVFAVPGNYRDQQLAILQDIALACGLRVDAILDAGLLAGTDIYPHEQLIHLDISLHRMIMTGLEQQEQRAVAAVDLLARGLVGIHRTWVDVIARNFVRATRFNPFHKATTEQALYDQLPGWLDRLGKSPVVELSLSAGAHRHRIMQSRKDLDQLIEPVYRELAALVQRHRREERHLVLNVSHRISALPGMVEFLQRELADCSVVPLQAGAAGANAARQAAFIEAQANGGWLPVLPCYHPFPDAPKPLKGSHLVYRGLAQGITGQPLYAFATGNRELRFGSNAEAGAFFSVACRADGWLQLELIEGMVWRNGVPVEAITRLEAGDRIRQAGISDEILVVAVLPDAAGSGEV